MNGLRDTWLMFKREHQCSIDRMLCNPTLRSEFLKAAKSATGVHDEESLLWELMSLRKRKVFSSSHNSDVNSEWCSKTSSGGTVVVLPEPQRFE